MGCISHVTILLPAYKCIEMRNGAIRPVCFRSTRGHHVALVVSDINGVDRLIQG
jgi:hypothetical protein